MRRRKEEDGGHGGFSTHSTLEMDSDNFDGDSEEGSVVILSPSPPLQRRRNDRHVLKELLKEEEELMGRVAELKASTLVGLMEVNQLIVKKEVEIEELTKMIRKMVSGGGGGAISKLPLGDDVGTRNENGPLTIWKRPEQIFPEEVWELILSNLSDLKDLQNCANAAPLFGTNLPKPKTTFLFPQIFPSLCRHLDNSLILKCRGVCRDWKDGVDHFLENHSSLRPFHEGSFNPRNPDLAPPLRQLGRDPLMFSNDGGDMRYLDFRTLMGDHPGNPFVTRAVTIHVRGHYAEAGRREPQELRDFLPADEAMGYSREEQQEWFWTSLHDFLERFGEHIWYLNFESMKEFFYGNYDRRVVRLLTRDIFRLLPNLRRLRIGGFVEWTGYDYVGELAALPEAPNLETLQMERIFRDDDWTNPLLLTLARKHHGHLKKLHIQWVTWQHIFRFNLDWPNLVELNVDGACGELDIGVFLHSKMPHLKKLGLTPNRWTLGKYDFQSVTKIILGLSATTGLSVVRLYGSFETDDIAQAPAVLFAPPSLKTLEVEHIGPGRDYNFLLRFPFLENLILFWSELNLYKRYGYEFFYDKEKGFPQGDEIKSRVRDFKDRDVFQLHQFLCEKRIYECKIWELLPRLKVFTCQREVFTREGFERFRERKDEAE